MKTIELAQQDPEFLALLVEVYDAAAYWDKVSDEEANTRLGLAVYKAEWHECMADEREAAEEEQAAIEDEAVRREMEETEPPEWAR